jgi:hypothetical protein
MDQPPSFRQQYPSTSHKNDIQTDLKTQQKAVLVNNRVIVIKYYLDFYLMKFSRIAINRWP